MKILHLGPEFHLEPCRKTLFAALAIAILVVSIYSNTFDASWHFDDELNILKEKSLHLKELSWEQVKQILLFTPDERKRIYRPAARLSFALNYYFSGDDVFFYHLVNVSIHILASLFLFLLVFHTLNLPLLKARYGANSYSVALLAAVLWAINPVHTQAVTYIVQRMASLAGLFYVMSMTFYLKGRTAQKRSPKIIHYFCCVVTAVLAFGSKENAAMLPISILFFDLFLIQGLTKETIRKNSYLLLALIFIPLALGLVLGGASLFNPNKLLSYFDVRGYTLFERLLTEPRVILFYLTQLFYPMPTRLSILHDIPVSRSLMDPPATLLAILLVVLIIGIAIIGSRRWPLISYCILFFFLNHLIESTIFNLELVFEHRNYIPSMLLFVPVALLVLKGIDALSYKKSLQALFCIFIVLVLVGQGHSTFVRNFVWKTEETLWLDAIDKSPNLPRPHHNLGRYYGKIGLREKEIAEYESALALEKEVHGETRHVTHYNLALAYNSFGRQDEAIGHLKQAIRIDPGYTDAYAHLAAILIQNSKYDEAFDYLIKALSYDRHHAGAHHNLGLVLLKKRRMDEAVSEFNKALALDRDSVTTLLGLGIAYKYKKDFVKAEHYLRMALVKNKKNIMTRLHLIETLFLMQDKDSLSALLEETLEVISPEKMKSVFEKIATDRFPDQEAPDLNLVAPLLGKAYLSRSDTLRTYGSRYLESARAAEP